MSTRAIDLTTKERVKARLGILTATTTWDDLFDELIHAASSYISKEIGRPIVSATYTQELYEVDPGQKLLTLRKYPVASISAIQYRAGTPSAPSWTDFPPDSYELVDNGELGVLRLYISLSDFNAMRITYVAGWVITFATEATHTLPYEISDLCERLVARAFKKREAEGKGQEAAAAGGTTTWLENISADDKRIISRYNRHAFL